MSSISDEIYRDLGSLGFASGTIADRYRAYMVSIGLSYSIDPRFRLFSLPAATRDTLVYGEYKPVANVTAGLANPNAVFTTVNGTQTLATPDQTFTNRIFNGTVFTAATGLVFNNCVFLGSPNVIATTNACIRGHSSIGARFGGAVFNDCVIKPQRPSVWMNGALGENGTFNRCLFENVVDAFSLSTVSDVGSITTIRGCVIRNPAQFTWTPPDTGDGQSDNVTHNDGVQFHRCKNVNIIGNSFMGVEPGHNVDSTYWSPSNCILLKQEVSDLPADMIENVLIDKNWFTGGQVGVNIAYAFSNPLVSATISNNKFTRGGHRYYIIRTPEITSTITGNVFEDDGSPVPITVT